MDNLSSFVAMVISEILIVIMFITIFRSKDKTQLKHVFQWLLFFFFVWTLGSILQILFQNSAIEPITFEMIAGLGVFFAPVAFLIFGLVFAKTKVTFRWYHIFLLIIPIISEVLLVTNHFHYLFFVKYSVHIDQMIYGDYFVIHSLYTYALFIIGIIYFLRYSIKNSGFFSKQSILIIISTLIPVVINVLGTLHIMPMTTYSTPISFTYMILIFALAIFKFDFMKVTPIALQKIVDRISDGYLVLDDRNIIIDFNKTCLDMFGFKALDIRNKGFFKMIEESDYFNTDMTDIKDCIEKVKNSDETYYFEKKIRDKQIYFNIEINSIKNKKTFLGTLILFKDTTQHVLDMHTIQNNQNMLMERERLASLGQLIGGIAHNLKTPIMSISGAAEGLSDLIKEYKVSVSDQEVTVEDHYDIAKDMSEWVHKIRDYTEYMSDVITAVKGQAVTMSDEQAVSFNLDELVKRVDILMKHELKNALVTLNVQMNTDPNITLRGNINSLVQVINNMISNAIQAYKGEPNKNINFIIRESENKVVLSIQDFAAGLPEEVQSKLFKEMITTKGKNGTGLGLFMSYSTIRAHFNGQIQFETEKGKGTIFHIILPK